ncbi:MAG: ABC transporter substrate-binding protein [Clostridia bacterium]|nr:ABC transporter substrate-binding protein [Clostridia bacterium]
MKKLLAIITTLALLCCCFAGCGAQGNDDPAGDANQKYTVGICQLVTHDALDAATKGFKDVLIEEFGDNIEFIEVNAANNPDTCTTAVNDFVSKKVDLIMANATPALQAAYNATTEIPILGTSVTEYGVALEIEDFNGTVGGNVSGTSDLAPLTEQAQMIIDLVPTAKTVGMLYCKAEANSAYQVKVVKDYLEGKGLTVKDFGFNGSEDVASVSEAAASACDAIYIPTDNTAASCTETINGAVAPKKVPIIAGEAGICSGCGIATLSISYEELGRTTGAMAVKILKGEADIEEMAIEYDNKPVKKYNKTLCDELGITIPEGYEELK